MNNPNPFVPKGSLLEQQSQRRSRLKIAVGCVVVVGSLGLITMLIQGCKREAPDTANATPPVDTNMPALDTNAPPVVDTNLPPPLPPVAQTNAMVMPPPPPPPVAPDVTAGIGTDYVVVQGDTLAKIAKAHGVTLKALEAANPGVDPKKLKIKQKLTIPASTKSDATSVAPSSAPDASGGENYTVKSGDTLTKVAKKQGVSLKALKAANNLTTDHIKVGEKLVIPAKAEAAAPAPTTDNTALPAVPPPAPMPAPATPAPAATPGH